MVEDEIRTDSAISDQPARRPAVDMVWIPCGTFRLGFRSISRPGSR